MNDFHCFKNNSISVALQNSFHPPKQYLLLQNLTLSGNMKDLPGCIYITNILNQGLWETRCFLFVRFNKTYLHCFQFCVSKRQVTCP